ncbi:hypothetical protein [Candidatus Clostridium stratigraminis]|uniref:Tyr recombinase domain-containing protein n=1 Tax=Candidatus Clostridium stratigraminis TaxID=3381661 RepID=A0ABW8T2N2_9CLOT
MSQYTNNKLMEYMDTLNFRDDELKNLTIAYINKCEEYHYTHITNHFKFVSDFKVVLDILQYFNKDSFQWESIKQIIIENIESRNYLINFAVYLSTCKYLDSDLSESYKAASKKLLKAIPAKLWCLSSIEKMKYVNSLFITEYKRKDSLRMTTFIVNVKNTIVYELLCNFSSSNTEVLKQSKEFFEIFEDSVRDKTKLDNIKDIKDFSYDIFEEQFKFYDSLGLSNILCAFYLYLWGFDPNHNLFPKSSGIDYKTLKRKEFYKDYKAGYRLVLYNPHDPVPLFDKWIIFDNGFGNNSLAVNNSNGQLIDFNKINNQLYRHYVKTWLWKDTSISIFAKVNYYFYVSRFFNFLSSNKKDNENIITLEDALTYKNHTLATVESDTNASKYMYNIRGVLRYLKDEKLIEVEDSVLYHLKYPSKSKNQAKVVANEDLQKLADLMKENAETSDLDKLYYLIYYLLLETEFRITHILALETDCVKPTAKKDQYIIKSKTKTSNGYEVKQSITIYVKKQIDDILRITENLRNECNEKDLKKRLFIKRNYSRKLIISPVTRENFTEYLSDCCDKLGISHYTASNLRDTHITKAEEFVIRKGLSKIEQSVLTGHTNTDTDNRHYVESNITDMLEIIHGTIIGDIDINGQVVISADKSIANEENEVENGCGYCKSEACKNTSFLSCFMCEHFMATVDRIPYFEEQLKLIEYKIPHASIQHDKEDLLNIKQLLLNYLKALYLKSKELISNV